MIARVIISVPTRNKTGFEYSFEGGLEKYFLVRVPFRRSTELGFVSRVYRRTVRATKPIKSTASRGPVFTAEQALLAEEVAEIYISDAGQTLLGFLPKLNFRDLAKIGGTSRLSKGASGKTKLLLAPLDERVEYFWQMQKIEGQNLIILPGIKLIEKVYGRSKQYNLKSEVVLWHSGIKSEQKATIWQKILSGKDATVVGTRDALFLPFRSLRTIFIDDPTNFAYQEDQRPYYHAYKVAAILKNIFHANLILGEDIPDLYSFLALKTRKIELVEKKQNIKISKIVEFQKIQKHPDLVSRISREITKNNKLCVLGPWRREAKIVCEECKTNVVCPVCGSEHFDHEKNYCAQCLEINSVAVCRNCRSTRLKYIGFSYKNIKKELEDIFPGNKIFVPPPRWPDGPLGGGDGDEGFSHSEVTLASLSQLDSLPPVFGKAYIPYFEIMQNNPNLGARQTLFKKIISLRNLGVEKIFVSKDEGDSAFLNSLETNNWRAFLEDELRQRKEFGLPPYKKGVQIVVRAKKRPKIVSEVLEKIKPFVKTIDRGFGKTLLIFDKSKYPKICPYLRSLSDHNIRVESDPMELF